MPQHLGDARSMGRKQGPFIDIAGVVGAFILFVAVFWLIEESNLPFGDRSRDWILPGGIRIPVLAGAFTLALVGLLLTLLPVVSFLADRVRRR